MPQGGAPWRCGKPFTIAQSMRAFTSRPVAKKTLLHLLDAAIQAPSARNLQPWQFVVVTGKARERLVQRLSSRYQEEVAPRRTTAAMELAEPFQTRVRRFMEALQPYAERQPNFDLIRGSLSFYNAPAVILVALDKSLASGSPVRSRRRRGKSPAAGCVPGLGHLCHRHRLPLPGSDPGGVALAEDRQSGDDRSGRVS